MGDNLTAEAQQLPSSIYREHPSDFGNRNEIIAILPKSFRAPLFAASDKSTGTDSIRARQSSLLIAIASARR
jgi:hypothetical protein